MLDLTVNTQNLRKNIQKARDSRLVIPTLRQMREPAAHVPAAVLARLRGVGLWDTDPLNLFRITWKNEPSAGGGFGRPNFIELPRELTGVPARIVCMVGKYFPTGCHKVGASFGCLAPRLVTGQFDAAGQKAVWPSTGNFCRGGAFNSRLLGVRSVAILPRGMSRERFEWLSSIAGEVIATPGTESNVKEIFDKTNELRAARGDVMIFNQFEEFGNYLWHYSVTGPAIAEAFESLSGTKRFAGACFTSGSAGTMASGDYLKQQYPHSLLAVGEALQCPTILNNGFGAHRIEGIGDKHIPWVHNVRNTDMAIAIDDADAMALLRLFNEPAGRGFLAREAGLAREQVNALPLMGISGIANMLMCIKFARYYDLRENDVVATVLTDSADMYKSRLEELRGEQGEYSETRAAADFGRCLAGVRCDNMAELGYAERKRVHNLKYYTWVEQQGKTSDELDALWYGGMFEAVQKQADAVDALIDEFNERAGVLRDL